MLKRVNYKLWNSTFWVVISDCDGKGNSNGTDNSHGDDDSDCNGDSNNIGNSDGDSNGYDNCNGDINSTGKSDGDDNLMELWR